MLGDGPAGWGLEEEAPAGQGVAEGDPAVRGSWGGVRGEEQQEVQFLKGEGPEVHTQLREGC